VSSFLLFRDQNHVCVCVCVFRSKLLLSSMVNGVYKYICAPKQDPIVLDFDGESGNFYILSQIIFVFPWFLIPMWFVCF
jgi:hypothetical protein